MISKFRRLAKSSMISIQQTFCVELPRHATILLFVIIIAESSAYAQSCESSVGSLYSLQGDVRVNSSPAVVGQRICSNDNIDVSTDSRAGIFLTQTQTVVRIDQNTIFSFQSTSANKTLIDIYKGIIHLFTRKPTEFGVKTLYANAMVEGTEFVVSAMETQSKITVIEGYVRIENTVTGKQDVLGESSTGISTESGSLFTNQLDTSDTSVYWAVHYPLINDSETNNDLIQRISQHLSKGRHQSASKILESALIQDPNDAKVLAMQSIIATAQRRLSEALDKAKEAVREDPMSSLGHTALSYVYQATFDLDSALVSARKAVKNNPDSSYAISRLAEVEISQGDYASALNNIERAIEIDPNYSRIYTMQGFVYLNQRDLRGAEKAFIVAAEYDNSDPIPQLGLGLVKIKNNKLIEGRKHLEIAVSLDPLNSLLRSYLGKAYYEEENPLLADVQFSLAKKLDKNDPTAWYYDALSITPGKTPITELKNLQQAIRLNDNRAIYRSRLALDSDLATRGANLARFYQQLGFNKQSAIEAAISLEIDPANHSAHQFLSQTYNDVTRHESARVSELLQSQLLNPLNIEPIPPSRSFTYSGISTKRSASLRPGYNEYTSLFEVNKPLITMNLETGNHELYNGDIVATHIQNNFSLTAGVSKHRSDGYRPNNSVNSEIQNVFSQWTPNNQYSIQGEYRVLTTQQGDLRQQFDLDEFSQDRRRDTRSRIIRLGSRFQFNLRSTFLISGINSQTELGFNDNFTAPDTTMISVEDTIDTEANQIELQNIISGDDMNLITGLGSVRLNDNKVTDTQISGNLLPRETLSSDRKGNNIYAYFNKRINNNLRITMGTAYSELRDSQKERQLWQPKFGFIWKLSNRATMRGAYFKNLKRFLVADQSIEPTQIAGFNQLYDDTNGSRARRIGIAMDFHITNTLALTLESTQRKSGFIVGEFRDDRDESTLNGSVSWIVSDKTTFGIDFDYERFYNPDQPQVIANSIRKVNTFRVPVQLTHFFRRDFYVKFKTLFIQQELDRIQFSNLPSGRTRSVLADLAIGFTVARNRGNIALVVSNITDTEARINDDRHYTANQNQPTDITPERQITIQASYKFN